MRVAAEPGKRFGSWLVLGDAPERNGKQMYRCRCECGRTVDVRPPDLVAGRSQRCRDCGLRVGRPKQAPHCSRCGVAQTRENSRWRPKQAAFRPRCIACERIDFRKKLDAMSEEERRAFFRARNARSPARATASKQWSRGNLAAARAHRAVRAARQAGALVAPDECAWCRREDAPRLDAHHADYAAPLNVEFICDRCHRSHHKESA